MGKPPSISGRAPGFEEKPRLDANPPIQSLKGHKTGNPWDPSQNINKEVTKVGPCSPGSQHSFFISTGALGPSH